MSQPAGAATDEAGSPAPMAGAIPIVALGASAGGLQAYERFFRAMPADSGMAFVVVQHLDPHHASLLGEILQRSTPMPVVQARDQMALLANRVHICPPHGDLGLLQGMLQLRRAPEAGARHLPVDAFFRALALDQGSLATAIVLSGTGTDGTQGLQAVAEAGGRCLIQDPTTTDYDGMPRSAIDSGVHALVLPVEAMPDALLAARQSIPSPDDPAMALQDAPAALARILAQLQAATGHDFRGYKPSTIVRRVARRMAAVGLSDPAAYARRMHDQPTEAQTLFHDLLINVTRFFRDPQAFEALQAQVIPALLRSLGDERVLRIWVAGCATGEEAYSLAILLREVMDEAVTAFRVQIFATDLDADAIATARTGRYPAAIAQDLTAERLRRHFAESGDGWRVRKEIREMVVFAVQSVIKDPPFTRLDLVSCRNLMIYLEPALQERLMRVFHYALKPGGVLVLSPSEGIGDHGDLFEPLNRRWKFYRALASGPARQTVLQDGASWSPEGRVPAAADSAYRPREAPLAEFARRSLLNAYAPVSVVVDRQGTVLYVHGETGAYLRPAPGLPTHDVMELAVPGLQTALREALEDVTRDGKPVAERTVTLTTALGAATIVRLTVRQLPATEGGATLLLVSFQPDPAGSPGRTGRRPRATRGTDAQRLIELERELESARQAVNAVREERQAAIQDLKAANEELQSTNEELQSANEELQTSKEELQSLNEELATVNAELQNKLEQMSDIQDDMKNLLDSIRLGIVFLDSQLRIRRYTRDATQIYRLQSTDIGRALADIRSELRGDDLLADARHVLDSLVPVEREVTTADDRRYLGRIQPYRTVDNVIDGVVLTFADVTERERAREVAGRGARALAQTIVEAVPTPLVVLDAQAKLVTANQTYFTTFGGSLAEAVGLSLFSLGGGIWESPVLREALQAHAVPGEPMSPRQYALRIGHPGQQRQIGLRLHRISTAEASTDLVLLVVDPAEPAPVGAAAH